LKRCREEVKSDASQLRHPSLQVPKLPDPTSSTQIILINQELINQIFLTSSSQTGIPKPDWYTKARLVYQSQTGIPKPDWYTKARLVYQSQTGIPKPDWYTNAIFHIFRTLKITQKDLLEHHIDRLHELIQKAVFMETNGGLIKAMNMVNKHNGLPSIVANPKLPCLGIFK
jgi:hypothetical protein